MAQYQINYSCGHEGTVRLFGPNKDRDRKIKWLETQDCPRCARKERGLECRLVLMAKQVEIQFIGDTYPHKDTIKALGGYRFSKDLVSGMLSLDPQPGWVKGLDIGDKRIVEELDKIKAAGLPEPEWKAGILDVISTDVALKMTD